MVNDDRKFRKKKMKLSAQIYYMFWEKAWRPMRIGKRQFWAKKAKSILGLEPGLHGQNAGALPLAPPPLPKYIVFTQLCASFKSFALFSTVCNSFL